jgi:hypothetical protein
MKKILLNFVICVSLFIWFLSNIFAFDANLQLDKTEVNINDYINLRVEISSTEWWEIWITNIEWLEKFDLISQSQSQSSSMSMVVINWKTQSETKSTINLDLTLKPKNKWEFTIGPAVLEEWTWKVLTNTVKVKVWWDNLFINNNHFNTNNKINNSLQQKNINKDTEIETYDKVQKRIFDNSKDLYLLLIILLLTWIWFYLLNNKKIEFKNKGLLFKNDKWDNIKSDNKEKEWIQNEVNFEKTEDVKYPEINDNDFIFKVDNILRNKLELNFNIKNIKSKTYDELLKEIWKNDLLENLIKLINNTKYSNNIWNNNKILELLREI